MTSMSAYERAAFDRLTAPAEDSRSIVPKWARNGASYVSRSVQSGASKIPGNEAVADAYAKAAKGLMDFTTGNGLHSVNLAQSIERHQRRGNDVQDAEDFLKLDLRRCDELLPSRKRVHDIAAVAEGAAASLLITGATVSSTVSGGTTAAIALGAVAADSVVVMAGLGRIIGEVAVSYGYDPNLPEEELFALQVLGLGMAVGSAAKATALGSLSRLTQQMMRQATWTQLNQHLLVGVVNRAFATMGLRLTQKKLAQVIPVAGVLISGGVNLQLVHRVHAAAMQAYRLRFLTEKYNLSPEPTSVSADSPTNNEEPVLQVDELLVEVVQDFENEQGSGAAATTPSVSPPRK